MLKTIQIVALLQGIFLIFILVKGKHRYKRITFLLFLASVISVLLFLTGDDENNLFVKDTDLFLLDSSLFITFFFLFFRYLKSGRKDFQKSDYFFFIPNIIYLIVELSEIVLEEENLIFQFVELVVELTFLIYLLYIIYISIVSKSRNWPFYFAIPMALLLGLSYFNDILGLIGLEEIVLSSSDDFSSYLLLIIAFLFYFITFNLINNPKQILPNAKIHSYKKSNLNPEIITNCKKALINIMAEEKLFLNNKLSIHEVAKEINMPRQYVSEVLNLHMQVNFQDFINKYRIEEFRRRLVTDEYAHYTLFGIATEVGFNSKSTFNNAFKKFVGLTPQEYRTTHP